VARSSSPRNPRTPRAEAAAVDGAVEPYSHVRTVRVRRVGQAEILIGERLRQRTWIPDPGFSSWKVQEDEPRPRGGQGSSLVVARQIGEQGLHVDRHRAAEDTAPGVDGRLQGGAALIAEIGIVESLLRVVRVFDLGGKRAQPPAQVLHCLLGEVDTVDR
jgi:hypothetical protein